MKTRPGISKYFVAIVPPSPLFEQAWEWKEFFKNEFNAKAALNSPPHITLHMPFEWKTAKEEILIDALQRFASTQNTFSIDLINFGCFPPRVIFIQVAESTELRKLQSDLRQYCKTELDLFNANRLDQPYHPHVTVAFRDLKKAIFPNAWASVRDLEFSGRFYAGELVLLRHNGKIWEVKKRFAFSEN